MLLQSSSKGFWDEPSQTTVILSLVIRVGMEGPMSDFIRGTFDEHEARCLMNILYTALLHSEKVKRPLKESWNVGSRHSL